ncbi:hypothetical protein TNCV_3141721 [Trichonephila clavipes]|nr:hypothetical protein TNCV_3141721 [Trichonephila clavipes]
MEYSNFFAASKRDVNYRRVTLEKLETKETHQFWGKNANETFVFVSIMTST